MSDGLGAWGGLREASCGGGWVRARGARGRRARVGGWWGREEGLRGELGLLLEGKRILGFGDCVVTTF